MRESIFPPGIIFRTTRSLATKVSWAKALPRSPFPRPRARARERIPPRGTHSIQFPWHDGPDPVSLFSLSATHTTHWGKSRERQTSSALPSVAGEPRAFILGYVTAGARERDGYARVRPGGLTREPRRDLHERRASGRAATGSAEGRLTFRDVNRVHVARQIPPRRRTATPWAAEPAVATANADRPRYRYPARERKADRRTGDALANVARFPKVPVADGRPRTRTERVNAWLRGFLLARLAHGRRASHSRRARRRERDTSLTHACARACRMREPVRVPVKGGEKREARGRGGGRRKREKSRLAVLGHAASDTTPGGHRRRDVSRGDAIRSDR